MFRSKRNFKIQKQTILLFIVLIFIYQHLICMKGRRRRVLLNKSNFHYRNYYYIFLYITNVTVFYENFRHFYFDLYTYIAEFIEILTVCQNGTK